MTWHNTGRRGAGGQACSLSNPASCAVTSRPSFGSCVTLPSRIARLILFAAFRKIKVIQLYLFCQTSKRCSAQSGM
ncbi:hypothetical protein FA13DRAFT_1739008 [Coprinellus micaceus]|uniref:Uncharacterized protein n=1 Tax=Coprinellus micaceus TaxID=71717 RepID=A0A4Y7SS18_COPMI|nr:hypothetical protein FA13DRAFT_1739008 [Coprinellus micaceus]